MEFGVRLKNFGPWEATVEAAVTAEKLGFSSIWLNDHLLSPARPYDMPFREVWTSLSALGTLTHRVNLGTLVACNSFRNPALMAKMASTLDSITGGRVILGIGAGWHKPEYEAYGYEYGSVGERMEKLDESVRIIRTMLRDGKATFRGEHYTAKDAPAIQIGRHRVPVWVGGGGARLVRMAARLGDGWNSYRMDFANFKTRIRLFHDEARRVGRPLDSLSVSMVTDAMVARSKQKLEQLISATARERGETREEYEIPEAVVVGDSAGAARIVRQLEDAGVRHLILNFPSFEATEQLEYFAREVIPQFKSSPKLSSNV